MNEAEVKRTLIQQLDSWRAAGVQQFPAPAARPSVAEAASAVVEPAAGIPPAVSAPPAVSDPQIGAAGTPAAPPVSAPVVSPPSVPLAKPSPRTAAGSPLQVLREEVAACQLCSELASTRKQTVFGTGNPQARLCFFGEAPGADEDRLGEPFVGKAGQLLTKIIEAMTLSRDEVYILNTLKCRPPGNRNPTPDEVANCRPFFERQIDLIQPEILVCLGAVAAQSLLDTTDSIGRLRGKFYEWRGIRVLATYHPAYLLRSPNQKRAVWEDMQLVMRELGLRIPG